MTYGCHNSERKDSYLAPDRAYHSDGFLWRNASTTVIDTSSRECRYDMRETDKKCEGCLK